MSLKVELIKALDEFFKGLKPDVDVKRVEWELDNMVYPYIGSYIASGELTKEEGKEVFEFCEIKLAELKRKRNQ